MKINGYKHVISFFLAVAGSLAALFLLVAVIAGMPELFSIRLGSIVLNPSSLATRIFEYVLSWTDGTALSYTAGQLTRDFAVEAGAYWRNSFFFLSVGLMTGITLGTLLGMLLAAKDLPRLEDYLGSIGVMPDFLVALLLQVGVIGITTLTGVRIARVASLGTRPALLLPMISMGLYPMVSAMHLVSARISEYRGADFVVNALARGIGPARLYRVHLLPGVLQGLRAELPRLLGIQVATLFIAERVYQSKGVVRWMFSYVFSDQGALQLGGYQYGFMVHCLILLLTAVLATYFLARGILTLVERGLCRA